MYTIKRGDKSASGWDIPKLLVRRRAYDSMVPFINMDFDGLKTAILEMLSGAAVPVIVTSFKNDMVSFVNKDDVLTLLIQGIERSMRNILL